MKTPWHLWVVGIVSLLWNAGGAFDYVVTETGNQAYLSNFTPDQLEYFNSFPAWMVAAWATAVWGGVLGSVLLLMRSGLAVLIFALSLLGMVAAMLYSFVLSGVDYLGLMGAAAGWFSLAIAVVAVLLFIYARRMRQAGVLG